MLFTVTCQHIFKSMVWKSQDGQSCCCTFYGKNVRLFTKLVSSHVLSMLWSLLYMLYTKCNEWLIGETIYRCKWTWEYRYKCILKCSITPEESSVVWKYDYPPKAVVVMRVKTHIQLAFSTKRNWLPPSCNFGQKWQLSAAPNYFSYIVVVSFIGGENWSTRRKRVDDTNCLIFSCFCVFQLCTITQITLFT
jgi:hypothetical protein